MGTIAAMKVAALLVPHHDTKDKLRSSAAYKKTYSNRAPTRLVSSFVVVVLSVGFAP